MESLTLIILIVMVFFIAISATKSSKKVDSDREKEDLEWEELKRSIDAYDEKKKKDK